MRILLVLVATTAFADAPKYTRKPIVTIPVNQSARTKPIPPAPLPKLGPTLTAPQVLEVMRRAEPMRVEQERILEQLIKDTPETDPQKPDLMFRLAEHYAQQLRFWRIESNEPVKPAGTPQDE